MATKVEVKIFDEYYPLRSEGDGIQYIKQLSAMLDERLKTVADSKHTLTRSRVAVVTALQIADEYCRLYGEKTELENAARERDIAKQENDRMKSLLDQLQAEKEQNDTSAAKTIEKLKNEVECLIESNTRLLMEKRELAKAQEQHIPEQPSPSYDADAKNAEIQELMNSKAALEAENDRLTAANSTLDMEKQELQDRLDELTQENEALEARLNKLSELRLSGGEDSGVQKKYDILSKAHAKLKKDYAEMMDILEELSNK